MYLKYVTSLCLMLASTQSSAGSAWPQSPLLPSSCQEAHSKALTFEWKELTRNIEQCLLAADSSKITQGNVLDLLSQAYKVNEGVLPSDFRLPDGLVDMKLSQRRNSKSSNLSDYIVELKGEYGEHAKVEKVRLIKHPGMVILSEHDKDVEFEEDEKGFNLKGTFKVPLSDGLYQIQIKMRGKDRLDQWVPVVDWISDSQPVIVSPQPDALLETANPVFAWQPYHTDDLGYASRRFTAAVVSNDAPNYDWNMVWAVYRNYDSKTRFVVGEEPDSEGVNALSSGRYLALVTYHDVRRYGQLKIGKLTRARQVFYVK